LEPAVSLARRPAVPLAALLALSGCASDDPPSREAALPDGPRVAIELLAFRGGSLAVPAGTTVSWVNEEALPHTVTTGSYTVDPATKLRCSDCAREDGLLDASLPEEGSSTSFTFREPGTFTYFCSFHRGMNAAITVTPA